MTEEMNFQELQEMVSVCLEQIISLKEENKKLKMEFQELSNALYRIITSQKGIVDNMNKMHEESLWKLFIQENTMNNIKYELADPRKDKNNYYFPKFYEIETTIDYIANKKKSMARFGDGEFEIMSNKERQSFQHFDERLAKRLKAIIQSEESDFLIAIADNYGSLDVYNEKGKTAIREYMTDEIRNEHKNYLDMSRVYHNTYISRPYVAFADNTTEAPKRRFQNLKRIWDKRNIIFVEGSLTRLGVGNDLFDNAQSIRRIEAPPVNSFDKYDEILDASLKFAEEDCLFLIALGPSAGVLAYDLYKAGYQAVDIGHLDLEYEWFLQGKGERCQVKNKYNNELDGGDEVEDIYDEAYLSQIVCTIE